MRRWKRGLKGEIGSCKKDSKVNFELQQPDYKSRKNVKYSEERELKILG
jgi:hypothetical protein